MDICYNLVLYYFWEDSSHFKYCRDCYLASSKQLFIYKCYESIVNGKTKILKCDICKYRELYNHNSSVYTNEEYSDSE